MSELNPYDLVGMRKAAERGSVERRAVIQSPDLLSLGDKLAEAARILRDLDDLTSAKFDEKYPQFAGLTYQAILRSTKIKRDAALSAWDAARRRV